MVDSETELQGYNVECLQTTSGVIERAASTSTETVWGRIRLDLLSVTDVYFYAVSISPAFPKYLTPVGLT